MTATHRSCRMCAGPVSRWNKTGLCRRCVQVDPDMVAKRAKQTRVTFAARPDISKKQREASAQFNRTERMRQRTSEENQRLGKIWKARASINAETRKRQMITRTERQLAHVPPDQRRLYFVLTRQRKMNADDALRLCLEQEKIDLARFARSLPIKEQEPC